MEEHLCSMTSKFINLVYIMKGLYICKFCSCIDSIIILQHAGSSELGSIVFNAPDLDNTTLLYDLRDFTLLLAPGITLLNIGHLQRLSLGQMAKVSICVTCVYALEKQYSVSCNSCLQLFI